MFISLQLIFIFSYSYIFIFYILDKLDSYSLLHYNIIYNYKNIDDLADSYENLSCSTIFNNNNYNHNSYNNKSYQYSKVYKIFNIKNYKKVQRFRVNKKYYF